MLDEFLGVAADVRGCSWCVNVCKVRLIDHVADTVDCVAIGLAAATFLLRPMVLVSYCSVLECTDGQTDGQTVGRSDGHWHGTVDGC